MAGVTVKAAKEMRQAGADARAVPADAGPAQAREGARVKKARADKPGN
ncbi:hypothetical protein [Desulfobacter sp.]